MKINATVRRGEPRDVARLMELILELAHYERAANEVVNNAERLEADCFGPQATCWFYVAECDGVVQGAALVHFKYSTWKGRCLYLEDLIVSEPFRRHGLGRLLMNYLVGEAKQLGVSRIDWQVLNWNQPAIDFYATFGAEISNEWLNGRLAL